MNLYTPTMAKERALEIAGTRAGTHKSKKTAAVIDLDVEKTANDGPESKTTNATQLS